MHFCSNLSATEHIRQKNACQFLAYLTNNRFPHFSSEVVLIKPTRKVIAVFCTPQSTLRVAENRTKNSLGQINSGDETSLNHTVWFIL